MYQTQQGDLSRPQPAVGLVGSGPRRVRGRLGLGDIDGIVGDGPLDPGLRERMPAPGFAEQLGYRSVRFHARSAVGAGSTAAGSAAAYAVSHGLAEVVVIVNAVAGRGAGDTSANRDEAVAAMAKLSGPYEYVYGMMRVSDCAVMAMRHMHDYGTMAKQWLRSAVAQRHAATLHPLSVHGHRGELTDRRCSSVPAWVAEPAAPA